MNNNILSLSTLFLLFPIFCINNNKKNFYEIILKLLLSINVILSFLFWINPIKNSLIHFYDGIFAKISFIVFSMYIIFIKVIEYKIKLIFLIILFLSSIMFYHSNNNSKYKWGCKKHLICHFIFHFLITLGCSLAFI